MRRKRVEVATHKKKEENMTEFQGVLPAFNQTLTQRGYTNLTPVQKAVLDPDLHESDLLVSAQTGSGKTVAFGLALAPALLNGAEHFSKADTPLALVIAPTRELALQVARELEWLYKASGAKVASCVGGMDIRKERDALNRGAHIVVGTPGRLCDHVKRGSFDTSGLHAVVLDEADEMLDMGFRDELEYILDTAPQKRRTLLFSATVPKTILSMAKRYQNDAKRITTKEEKAQHVDIEYQGLTIAPSDRENAIINLLRYHEAKNAIIFCATRAAVNHLTSRLTNRGFSVVALSGELSQAERSNALQSLRDGRAQVCVATDVASRGIDLPGLALVVHADIPKNRDILLHRSGRTGRAGSKGVSALIVPYNWRTRTERLLQNAKVEAKWGKPPSIKDILERDRDRFLSSPALNTPIQDDEKSDIEELISRYSPEAIAAALIRSNQTQKPAPEELLDAAPSGDNKKPNRDNFKNSVWISLSAGRNMSAEVRWILPMICGAGNITKRNVGAIKISQNETYVELTADCINSFFKAIGEGGKVEKDIVATRLDGAPDIASNEQERQRRPKKNFGGNSRRNRSSSSEGNRNSRPQRRSGGTNKSDENNKSRDEYKPRGDKNRDDRKPNKHSKKKYDDRKTSSSRNNEGDKARGDFKKKSKSGFKDNAKTERGSKNHTPKKTS